MSAIKNPAYKTRSVKNAFLGEMLTFKYFPKHEKTLAYWDSVPLIIIFEKYKDGFLGMNLHYMPKGARKVFVAKVKAAKNSKRAATGMMKSLMRNPKHGFLWKRYLYSHVKSRVVNVPTSEWDYIVQLPVQFNNATHQKVYSDYRKY